MVYKLVNKPTKGKQKHEPLVPVWGYSRALAIALTAQKKIKSQLPVTTEGKKREGRGRGIVAEAELKESYPDILWFSFVETFSQRP